MDKKKIQELVIVVLAALIIGLIAGRVAAAELNAAGPAEVMAAAAKGNILFNAGNPSGLPVAVLVYSGDGAEFWIKRAMGGTSTLETIPIKIPAGSSMIIPVGGWKVTKTPTDTFRVKINVNAVSVTDSVFVIPMYR